MLSDEILGHAGYEVGARMFRAEDPGDVMWMRVSGILCSGVKPEKMERGLKEDSTAMKQESTHRFEMLQSKIDDQFDSLGKRFEEKAAQHDADNAEVKSLQESNYRHFEGRCDTGVSCVASSSSSRQS